MKTWHIVLGLAVVGVAGFVVYKVTRPQPSGGDGVDPSLGGDQPAPLPAPAQVTPAAVYVQPAAPPAAVTQPAPVAAYSTSDPRDTAIDDSTMSGWDGYN